MIRYSIEMNNIPISIPSKISDTNLKEVLQYVDKMRENHAAKKFVVFANSKNVLDY